MITNASAGTNVHEVAAGIYRINTPIAVPGGAFNFNQYLVAGDEPLVFHTGPRKLFALVREAIGAVMPVAALRHVAFSHFEADECGSLNDFLAAAPGAAPACSHVAAMVSINDVADRPARVLRDGDTLDVGGHRLRWIDTPHVPHGWESGVLFDETTGTLFCGDLFTQPGRGEAALTEADILAPSEAFRSRTDYYTHAPRTGELLEKLAGLRPATLACMHGAAWKGDGARLLRELAAALTPEGARPATGAPPEGASPGGR